MPAFERRSAALKHRHDASEIDNLPSSAAAIAALATTVAGHTASIATIDATNLNTTAPLEGGGQISSGLTLSVDTFGDANSGVVPASGGGTSNYLRADGTWAAPSGGGGGGSSPLTTKGDLWGYDTADNRIAVGANGKVLMSNSGVALGVEWTSLAYTDVSGLATVAHTGAYSDLTGAPSAITPAALTKTDDTNVTVTLGGTPATALLQAASLTLGWTGTLAVPRGGSGAATLTGYLKGNGAAAFTASATIPYSDLSGTPTLLASPLTTKGDLWGFSSADARLPVGTDTWVLTADSTAALGVKWAAASGGGATGANPSASVGLSAVNGSALTFLRSDGAPALSQSIAPTWTGAHTFTNAAGVVVSNTEPYFFVRETGLSANEKVWGWESHNKHMYLGAYSDAYGSRNEILDVTRGTGTALVDLSFGNATDNPSYTFLGNGSSSFAGNMAVSSPAGGTPITVHPAAGERGIEVNGATAAGPSVYLRNTDASDGRCVVAFSADRTSFYTYLAGIDTTGSNVKNFEIRDVTRGGKPLVINSNGAWAIEAPAAGIALTVNAIAGSAGLLLLPANSASVGMQITDPGAAGVLGRLSTTNASFILTAVNGTTLLNVGASTIATVSSTGVNVGGLLVSKAATSGVGYATGAGGTVTQATSRTTGVTLNKVCGAITLVSAAGSAAWQTFTVTNSAVAAADTVLVVQKSGTDLNQIHVTAVAAGSFKISFATTGGTTTEQPVFNFAVIKAVTA